MAIGLFCLQESLENCDLAKTVQIRQSDHRIVKERLETCDLAMTVQILQADHRFVLSARKVGDLRLGKDSSDTTVRP